MADLNKNVAKFPAPWSLKGNGYIFLYKFKKDFVEKNGNVPNFLKNTFCGGFGAIMLVNYQESNAGGYGELLFIPGKFVYKNKKLNTISKIYVSSMESVVNGRNNWGIPKEKANFVFQKLDNNKEKIIIDVEGKVFAEFIIKSRKMAFPVSTKLLPFPLVQRYEEKTYFTNFYGKGKGHFAKIEKLMVDPTYFPDVSCIKPLMAIAVDPFNIVFPVADIEK